jgi:hypothetical protein
MNKENCMVAVRRFCKAIPLLAISFLAAGCAGSAVTSRLCAIQDRPQVTFGYQGSDKTVDDHIYFSKEASSGGGGISSGGCGCN